MTDRLRTKMFEESQIVERPPGSAPGTWIVKATTPTVDEAINYWLQETGHELVSCSTPGFHVQWMDKEMTTRAIIVAVMVIYREAPHERTVVVPAAAPAAPPPPARDIPPLAGGPGDLIGRLSAAVGAAKPAGG